MAATVTQSLVTTTATDSRLRVDIVWTTGKLNTAADEAGQYLYEHHFQLYAANGAPIAWSTLSNAQKLSVIGAGVKMYLRDAAQAQHRTAAIGTAATTADSEIANTYSDY